MKTPISHGDCYPSLHNYDDCPKVLINLSTLQARYKQIISTAHKATSILNIYDKF